MKESTREAFERAVKLHKRWGKKHDKFRKAKEELKQVGMEFASQMVRMFRSEEYHDIFSHDIESGWFKYHLINSFGKNTEDINRIHEAYKARLEQERNS